MSEVAAPVVEPKAKTPKGKSPKAKATKPKVKPSHPGFNAMVEDAIRHLKERTGSSLAAIKKVIGDKHSKELPAHWEKHVTMAIRRLADSGKLVKVKGSFKLGEELKTAPKKKPTASKPKKTTEDEPKAVKKATVKKPKAEKKAPASAKKPKTDNPKVKKAAAPKTKKVAAASKPKAEKKPKATTPKPKKAVAVKKPAGVKKVKAAPKPKVVKASKATKA